MLRAASPVPQAPPAGHQGTQDEVGQLGILVHQPPERRRWHAVHLSGSRDPGAEVGRLAGQQAQLAHEPAGSVGDHDGLRRIGGLGPDDVNRAGIDQDQVIARVAGAEQQRAGLDLLRDAVALQPGPLLVAEGGVSLVRNCWRRHAWPSVWRG